MKIPLKNPIVFMDFETTGVDPITDKIVSYCFIRLEIDGSRTVLRGLLNPERPIPAEASKIHNIYDFDVLGEPTFRNRAQIFHDFINGHDVAGYGAMRFDFPLLYNEFRAVGIEWDYSKNNLIDVGNIFKIQAPRTLSAALKHYCYKEHTDAHDAEADVQATIDVFLAQCQKEDVPETISDIAKYSNYDKPVLDLSGKFTTDENGDVIFNFGTHRGEKAANHIDYILWMTQKDFAKDTLLVCNKILEEWHAL